MKYPEEGDKLWFFHDGYPLIIWVTVMEIHHGDVGIDEPVGFDLEYTDLHWTLEEAIDLFFSDLEEAKMLWDEEFPGQGQLEFEEDYTLAKYREEVDYSLRCHDEEEGISHTPQRWPDKGDDEWFSLRELRERRGMTRNDFEELYRDN
jgi:hypothetical protein